MAIGVRKITNIGSKKVIGKFPSMKMNTIIWWESQIERDYIYLLEIDPNVESYKGQPFKIHYTSSGSGRSYTPDFWVTRPDRQQVVEVKPASKVYENFPWTAVAERRIFSQLETIFSDRYFLASRELNLLNTILLVDELSDNTI